MWTEFIKLFVNAFVLAFDEIWFDLNVQDE